MPIRSEAPILTNEIFEFESVVPNDRGDKGELSFIPTLDTVVT